MPSVRLSPSTRERLRPDRIDTPMKLLHWVHDLSKKVWCDARLAAELVCAVCHHFRLGPVRRRLRRELWVVGAVHSSRVRSSPAYPVLVSPLLGRVRRTPRAFTSTEW